MAKHHNSPKTDPNGSTHSSSEWTIKRGPPSNHQKPSPTSKPHNGFSSTIRTRLPSDREDKPAHDSSFLSLITSRLKCINFLNIFVVLVLSVLINTIVFNFIYLPAINERTKPRLELTARPDTNKNYFGSLLSLSTLSSLIKWPSLSSVPSSSNPPDRFRGLKSYDHVSFPSLDDGPPSENLDQQAAIFAGLLDDESGSSSARKSLETRQKESRMALKLAQHMQKTGKPNKASKIFKYALSLDPRNPELLTAYGEYLELHKKDIIKAEHYYTKVVNIEPDHRHANVNLRRAAPIVSKIDRDMLDSIDLLLKRFYEIPSTNSALRRAKKDAYFMHIYHSNAIEGNTLNLQQTRHIIENRMAVGGKSVQEHNEVLGLDAAMRFINQTLLYKPLDEFGIDDLLEIHRRVLGFCDPIESGKFRKHQVYVGKFTPPSPEHVEQLMEEFFEWLHSAQLQLAHPIQMASLVHYKFVYIHPFYDGNGRTARLLMNLILMKFGYPPVIIKKQDRLEYYDYLEMANQGDIKPFVRFIARCTQRTLSEYIKLCNDSYSISVDDSAKMFRGDLVLNAFDDDYFAGEGWFRDGPSGVDDEPDDPDDGGSETISENIINTGEFSFVPDENFGD